MPDPIPTRNYTELPLPERLEEAHRILGNLDNHVELGALMSAYNYGPASANLLDGHARYTAARAAFDAQVTAQGAKRVATQAIAATFDPAYREYQRLAGVARVAFLDDPATRDALGLGTFPDRQVRRLEAFRQLSLNARTPERLAAFAAFNVTEADFDAFDPLVDAYDAALHAADTTRADAQHGTDTRDAEVDDLDAWIAVVQRIARIALQDHPQLLELVGLIAPS